MQSSLVSDYVYSIFEDDNKEITHTSFSIGKPNNVDYACVCVDPSGGPSWSWTDCDCTVERPFVCLKSCRKNFHFTMLY